MIGGTWKPSGLHDAVRYGTYILALRGIIIALAFHTHIGIDLIKLIAGSYGLGGAYGFTGTTVDAGIKNLKSHDDTPFCPYSRATVLDSPAFYHREGE